ncbi:MAG: ABC transporter permease [Candidatus Cloacimonadota bacterium]|nr:ABC transporter permease [Candidatus Cloacimonadota bacterium]
MKNILNVFKRELGIVVSDKSILLTILIAPLLYAFFLGSIYIYKDADQINFAVVDMDNTQTTRELYRLMDANQKINLIGKLDSYSAGIDKMNRMKIQGFLYFPKGFEVKLKLLQGAGVNLYLNTTRFLPSNDLNNAVQTIMLTAGAGIRLRYFESKGIDPKQALELVEPIMADVHPIYNTTNSYGNFLLPGLFLLILQQTLLIGFGESISKENEKDGFKKLFQTAKFKISDLIIGKIGFYFFLYCAYFVFFFVIIFNFFEIPLLGSIVATIFLSLLFLFSVLFYTIFFASFFTSPKRYMEIMAFTSYPLFLICGYSWPISAMPLPLKWLAQTVPTTPFFNAFVKVSEMGANFQQVSGYILHLLILILFSYIAVILRLNYLGKKFRKRINR